MKRWLMGIMAVVMAASLSACTPTTEKQKEETTISPEEVKAAKESAEALVEQSTGGVSDKVPDPNVKPVAIISIYRGDDEGGLIQDMDSLDTEGLDAQLLIDKMTEYGVLVEGTEVLSFDIQGEEEAAVGILDLNQAESAEGCSDELFLTEIGNTFIENFELSKLKLTVNGENYSGLEITQSDEDYLTYNENF